MDKVGRIVLISETLDHLCCERLVSTVCKSTTITIQRKGIDIGYRNTDNHFSDLCLWMVDKQRLDHAW